MLTLDIMDVQKGHEEYKYDESSREDNGDIKGINSVTQTILDKIRLGFILYGAKKGEDYLKVADMEILSKAPQKKLFVEKKLEELDRFILSKDYEKKLLAAPLASG